MSSPSNVVVVITHLPMKPELFRAIAGRFWVKWKGEPPRPELNRARHTDQLLDEFFGYAHEGKGFAEGAEGDCFSFAYAGNYINIDDFLEAIEPFIRELVACYTYTSATIFCQPHDAGFKVYKLDGAALASKAPNLKLHIQKRFEAYPSLSFDCDIKNIRTSDIREPVQGPPTPMTPEQAKQIEDLTRALSAGYGGPMDEYMKSGVFPVTKGQPLTFEALDKPLAKVSFVYTGERRANCKLCKAGHGLKCAFDPDGLFMADNYNCGTLSALRTLADPLYYKHPPVQLVWAGDQALVSIPISEDRFIMLGWYKQRGRTEIAQVIEEQHIQCLTRDIAEEAIEFYKKQNLETL